MALGLWWMCGTGTVVDVWHWDCGGLVTLWLVDVWHRDCSRLVAPGLCWACGTGAVVDLWHWDYR